MEVSKIRYLIKERNKHRGQRHRTQQKAPAAKRRKLNDKNYEARQEPSASPQEQPRQEKRKIHRNQETQPLKRRKTTPDIRKLFEAKEDKNNPKAEETRQEPQEPLPEPKQSHEGVNYGEEQAVEMVNWEEIFQNHIEETRRLEKVREEKIEKADKKEKS